MPNKKLMATLAVSLAMLAGCKSEFKELGNQYVKADFELEGTAYRIAHDAQGDLMISCPGGVVCDASFDYRAHHYEDEHIYLYLSFNPELVNDYSFDGLVEHFSYMNFNLKLPSLSSGDTEVYFHHREPLSELGVDNYLTHTDGMLLQFHSYIDGTLTASVSGTITTITHRTEGSSEPDCITDDILGLCYEEQAVYMPFSVDFALKVKEQ